MKFNIFLFIIAIAYSAFAANVNNTISDIYSVFKYKDGIEYFENLNCNSDNDCPERASCIGNKCFTSFYCKKGDKSTCSLFLNFCDGKSCYKRGYSCNKDEECLEGKCHELSTGEKMCSTNTDEYSTGLFRYEDAETYFNTKDIDCTREAICPNHSVCLCQRKSNICQCAGSIYCNNNKTDCSFINDKKKGITDNVEIYNFPEIVDISGPVRSVVFFIINYVVLPVVLCACTYICFLIYKNRENGLKEESGPNLYILTKRAIIVLFIMEIVTIILRFIRYISWYDYDICHFIYITIENEQETMSKKSLSALYKISYEFPRYDDHGMFSSASIDQGLTGLIMVFSIIFLIFPIFCLKKCSMCFIIFTYLFCTISNLIYFRNEESLAPTISLALTSVPKEDIDHEIYLSLKDEYDFDYYYYGRKTWLKLYPILLFLECLLQFFLILSIKRNYINHEPKNKKELINLSQIYSSSQHKEV